MKRYCPRCESEDVFTYWEKNKKNDWAVCRKCWNKAPLYDFDPEPFDYEGQAADDWVHEWIIEHRSMDNGQWNSIIN